MDDVNNYTGDIQEGWEEVKRRLKFQTIPMSLIDNVITLTVTNKNPERMIHVKFLQLFYFYFNFGLRGFLSNIGFDGKLVGVWVNRNGSGIKIANFIYLHNLL